VLNRQSFRESDSKVTVYTLANGKIDLIARGTKKIKSKLAGHIEPITLAAVMIIRGRQFDYLGSSVSENSLANIKANLDKSLIAGQAAKIFKQLIKENVRDEALYSLLKSFLEILNDEKIISEKINFLYSVFIFKLLAELGYAPELSNCVGCYCKIEANNSSKFDIVRGGLLCAKCSAKADRNALTISDTCIKVLRLFLEASWKKILNLEISKSLDKEINYIVNNFLLIYISR
jgi:DNA repair protein RecO (recombination protein O)